MPPTKLSNSKRGPKLGILRDGVMLRCTPRYGIPINFEALGTSHLIMRAEWGNQNLCIVELGTHYRSYGTEKYADLN